MWTWWLCETRTGRKLLQVEALPGGSWSTLVSGIGSGSHQFAIAGSPVPKALWRQVTYPWANTIVQCWNDVPVYAGIVIDRALDRTTGKLTVRSKEFRQILSRRYPFRIGGEYNTGTVNIVDRTTRGMISDIVRIGVFKNDDVGGWNLPVSINASEVGPGNLTIWNYDFVTIENALAEREGVEDGPDVAFTPRWVGDRLDWLLQIGTPRLSGSTHEFPMNVDRPSLTDVSTRDDGSKMLTGEFAIGKGSEVDMRIGEGGGQPGPDIPFLDFSAPYKEIDDIGVLYSHATADVRAHRSATTQWDGSLNLTDRFASTAAPALGSTIRMSFSNDMWEDDGWVDQYLIGLSGDTTAKVSLDVQPLGSI